MRLRLAELQKLDNIAQRAKTKDLSKTYEKIDKMIYY